MEERNLRKTMIGIVSSDKMDKTVVVSVEQREMDKTYGKIKKKKHSNQDEERLPCGAVLQGKREEGLEEKASVAPYKLL